MSGRPAALIAELGAADPAEAEARVAAYLEAEGIELIGVRTLAEITERLRWLAADAKATPLAADSVRLIQSYLAVRAPAGEAAMHLAEHARAGGDTMARALRTFERRLALLREAGVDASAALFSTEFGRSLEYYTGFVFEVVAPELGAESPVAGGGRYDGLLKAAGAGRDVPAVGGAIHTERLLAAVGGNGQ